MIEKVKNGSENEIFTWKSDIEKLQETVVKTGKDWIF